MDNLDHNLIALCLVLSGMSVEKALADAKVIMMYPELGE
jgi:hypothetical protein